MNNNQNVTEQESIQILSQVDQAVNVLYNSTGYVEDSQRKDIERQLNSFKQMPNSWVHSLYFLNHSKNNYTLFYACSILENMLQTQWNNVEEGKRMHLREVVFTFLLGRNPPHFVLTKLIKILVDIGKLDWPERYPDFLKHILHTISNEKYQHFGVLLLKILIEEFTTNNSRQSVPVTGNRQRQILSSFLQNIPVIIETMTTTLLNLYGKLQHASSSGNNNIANQISSQCGVLFESYQILIPLFTTQDMNNLGVQLYSNKFLEVSFQIIENFPLLQCSAGAICTMNSLLANKLITPAIQNNIFIIIQQLLTIIQRLCEQQNDMRALLEEKNEHYFQHVNSFFECLFNDHIKRLENNASFPMKALLTLLLEYSMKQPNVSCFLNTLFIWEIFTDYIRDMNDAAAVVGGSNFKNNSELYHQCLMQFSSNLLERTLFVRNHNNLFQSLDTDSFGALEHWVPDTKNEEDDSADIGSKKTSSYAQNYSYNTDNSKLRTAELVLNSHSEVDIYLGVNVTLLRNLVVIEKVGSHLIPGLVTYLSEAINMCKPLLQPSSSSYNSNNNNFQVQGALHDLSTIVYTFTAGIYCLNVSFVSSLDVGFNILKTLVELGLNIDRNRLFTRGHHISKVLISILECITLFSHWLKTLIESPDVDSSNTSVNIKQYKDSLPPILHALAELFSCGIDTTIAPAPIPILRAHLKLFEALVINTNLTPEISPMLFKCYQNIWYLTEGLPLEVKVEVAVVVSNSILINCNYVKTLSNNNNNSMSEEQNLLVSYGTVVASVIGKIGSAAAEARSKHSIDRLHMVRVRQSLSQLTGICNSMVGRQPKERQVVAAVIKPVMSNAGEILNICLKQQHMQQNNNNDPNFTRNRANSLRHKLASNIATAKDILIFFNSAVNGLRRELGVETLSTIINGIMELFKSTANAAASNMTGVIGGGAGVVNDGSMVNQLHIGLQTKNKTMILLVKSLLSFLATVLEEPHKALRSLHSPIYNLVYGTIVPVVFSSNEIVDVSLEHEIFAFIRTALICQWRTFVKSNRNGGTFKSDDKKNVMSLSFKVLIDSFKRKDQIPENFQYNLQTFIKLNEQQTLFTTMVFENFISKELSIHLIQVLVNGTHDLLTEPIIDVLHRIAIVNYQRFANDILLYLIGETEKVLNSNHQGDIQELKKSFFVDNKPPDLLSFKSNILNFVWLRRKL